MTDTPATIHAFHGDTNVTQAVADRLPTSSQDVAVLWSRSAKPLPAIGMVVELPGAPPDNLGVPRMRVTAIQRDVVVRGAGRVDGPSALVNLVVGKMVLTVWKCPRCGRSATTRFTWAHKPLGSGIRTCGREPVPEYVSP